MKNKYADGCYLLRAVEHWHSKFKKGWQLVELIPHAGQLVTSSSDVNVDTVSAIIRVDRHLCLQKLEEEVHIPWSSFHQILCDKWKMCHILSIWVPYFLTKEHMNASFNMCKAQVWQWNFSGLNLLTPSIIHCAVRIWPRMIFSSFLIWNNYRAKISELTASWKRLFTLW